MFVFLKKKIERNNMEYIKQNRITKEKTGEKRKTQELNTGL
jgi:hypothetical protein